ncbi:hypothetical protein ABZX92_14050, partial [Lentzea sp. NPDC006480]|uniref:hypothetical protein n=1 Tax=Lentzea sp. NPDC006480 TaxID=3157176 RepID=UPI0033BE2E74
FPAGVDRADIAAYCLMLGDDALIFSRHTHLLQRPRSPTRSPASPARSARTAASAVRPRCRASRARGAT